MESFADLFKYRVLEGRPRGEDLMIYYSRRKAGERGYINTKRTRERGDKEGRAIKG